MEYILFIHNNVDEPTCESQWDAFFTLASESGVFVGGSEMGACVQLGEKPVPLITKHVDGFMRFEADDINEIYRLLKYHPVFLQGGTLELCEMPKTPS